MIIDLRIQAFWREWHVRDLEFSWAVQVSSDITPYRLVNTDRSEHRIFFFLKVKKLKNVGFWSWRWLLYPSSKFQYLFIVGQGEDVKRHLTFVLNILFNYFIPKILRK